MNSFKIGPCSGLFCQQQRYDRFIGKLNDVKPGVLALAHVGIYIYNINEIVVNICEFPAMTCQTVFLRNQSTEYTP